MHTVAALPSYKNATNPPVLHDDIAADNPSYKLFLKNGFDIEYQNEDVVMVKRDL